MPKGGADRRWWRFVRVSQVRIYDEATKTLQSTLSGGYGRTKAGHSNRVFSLKYSVDDPNLILSGGWDNTIQIWDVRQDVPVRSCFGPHITGDAVDLKGHEILSGSWRPEKQLQVPFGPLSPRPSALTPGQQALDTEPQP